MDRVRCQTSRQRSRCRWIHSQLALTSIALPVITCLYCGGPRLITTRVIYRISDGGALSLVFNIEGQHPCHESAAG